MLDISPRNIASWSRCPKRSQYNWDSKPILSSNEQIIESVIKSAYLEYCRKCRPATWHMIISWTEQYMVKYMIDQDNDYEKYKETKSILTRLVDWYHKDYLGVYSQPGLINIPIIFTIDRELRFRDSIPIITSGNKIRLFDFQSVKAEEAQFYSGKRIYNSIEVHARAWGFWKASNIMPNEYIRFVIHPESIKAFQVTFTSDILKKSEKIIKHIIRGIGNDVFYPSFSEQCIQCPNRQYCSI